MAEKRKCYDDMSDESDRRAVRGRGSPQERAGPSWAGSNGDRPGQHRHGDPRRDGGYSGGQRGHRGQDSPQQQQQRHYQRPTSSLREAYPLQMQSPSASSASSSSSSWGDSKLERPCQVKSPSAHSDAGSSSASGGSGKRSSERPPPSRQNRRFLPAQDAITRPKNLESKKGKAGDGVLLQANYFKVQTAPNWTLQMYNVSFSIEEDRTRVKKALLGQHREVLQAYIFDGSTLFTSQQLPEPLELQSERREGGDLVTITIKKVGELNSGDHQWLQVFNIILRKCQERLDLKLVGRNYYDPHARVEIRDWCIELWPGYLLSIRQHESNILMCAEISHKVMRDRTFYDILKDCINQHYLSYQDEYKSRVLGKIALTDYNNNTYRIDEVNFAVSPLSTFKRRNEEVSYMDYYQNKYNIRIRDVKQPLLVSNPSARDVRGGRDQPVYLVPELCRSTGLTDDERANFQLMRALANHTRVDPANRIKKLMAFNQRLNQTPNVLTELASWNLTVDRRLVEVPARVLPTERICYADKVSMQVPANANWQNDFRSIKLARSGELADWVVIVPGRLQNDCQRFVQTLMRVAGSMNFPVKRPDTYTLDRDDGASYAAALEDVLSKSNPMLVLCVAMNNRADRYAVIKKKCCIDRPVPTQVVLAKSLNGKSAMSIATKVAIQMNCKIGGTPWTVNIPATSIMVVGIDVNRTKGSKSQDYGAMVASLDASFGRYYSAVSKHTEGEKLAGDIAENLVKAIRTYATYNNGLPKRVVIYRDGESQTSMLFQEVKMIKKALLSLYSKEEDVKLAYVVVTKKINTRLFLNGRNPPPGTVVDDVITDPAKYDFFIVSQHTGQGTVSPTSYNVIEDSSSLNPDQLQRLTYKLCHLYFNWSGTVRVPAPVQYANKLSGLVSQSLREAPESNSLETLLYFL